MFLERFSIVSKVIRVFALVLLYFALWLVKKSRATFSTNQKENSNQSQLAHTHFPALGAGYMYLLRVLIGSLGSFVFVVIGWGDNFGFGFTTRSWKAL